MKIRRLRKFRKPGTGELITFESKQYYITDGGEVYDGNRHRYVKQFEMNNGYIAVNLRDNEGKWHSGIMVHNLVATCFLRLLEKGEQVHHIDRDRKNNNLSNLEIISASEHAREHNYEKWADGTMNSLGKKVAAKLMNVGSDYRPAKPVAQLDKNGNLIHAWPSTAECGRNGYSQGNVAACCRGCLNRPGNSIYKGYVWQWYEDYLAQQPTKEQQLELNFTED